MSFYSASFVRTSCSTCRQCTAVISASTIVCRRRTLIRAASTPIVLTQTDRLVRRRGWQRSQLAEGASCDGLERDVNVESSAGTRLEVRKVAVGGAPLLGTFCSHLRARCDRVLITVTRLIADQLWHKITGRITVCSTLWLIPHEL